MLQELSIRNFAIIDDLQISFSDGLTILSGETGAGKSIIINAVNLLLGTRASAKLIRTGADTAEVEAFFQISSKSRVADIMSHHGYDPGEGLLTRRIISRNERHGVYINGRLSTMQLLKDITENQASISGQHAHQGLLREDEHLNILDQFGSLIHLRKEVHDRYHQILPETQKLEKLLHLKDRQAEQTEFLEFQRKEIVEASLLPREDAELESEQSRLKHGEALYTAVHESVEALYNSQGSIVERLMEIRRKLEDASKIDTALSSRAKEVAGTVFHMEDVSRDLEKYLASILIDEKRLEAVEARLDTLNRLKRKYGGSLEAVQGHLELIEKELSEIENISQKIEQTKDRLTRLNVEFVNKAKALSDRRRKTAQQFSSEVVRELSSLKMSKTEFQVSFQPLPKGNRLNSYLSNGTSAIDDTGMDRVVFMIAPNVGEELKPLSGIASGGELSRLVLALKAILAETHAVETVVFDEVDSGIGGGVAEVVGRKLSELAGHHQIICITHLPQIARFGDHHFRITKQVTDGRTRTTLHPLDEKERVRELARMLGGETVTPTTLDHAREMLNSP